MADYSTLFRGKKILVVDDNRMNRLVALAFLKKVDVLADYVENGREAVEAVQAKEYDAILMDIQMPVMNGYEATLQIREINARMGRVPIIAVSANTIKENRVKCMECGMNCFIEKPLKQTELYDVLSSLL